jgi:hypothetical protein
VFCDIPVSWKSFPQLSYRGGQMIEGKDFNDGQANLIFFNDVIVRENISAFLFRTSGFQIKFFLTKITVLSCKVLPVYLHFHTEGKPFNR